MDPGQRPNLEPMSRTEQSMHGFLQESHLAGAHDIPVLVQRYAQGLGSHEALIYLADLQQRVLLPFLAPEGPPHDHQPTPLGVDSTVAGRAYQHLHVLTQECQVDGHARHGCLRVWVPLLNGSERLGVLAVTLNDVAVVEMAELDSVVAARLKGFASLVAELVMTKTLYGDTIVRSRRTSRMGLAAEIQWSLLPPLTFSNGAVTVTAGLEPAYEVAGDSVDYAVDADLAHFAVFDGMGHGLASALLVSLVVAAYRNARRAGQSLVETAEHVESAVQQLFGGDAFATGLLAELDTTTGIFTWLSAGHLEPLLLRHGRAVRRLRVEPELPFGLGDVRSFTKPEVSVGSEHLEPGDLLLLYTDGVTEARSPDGDFFGVQRLTDLVIRNLAAGLPAPETLRRVVGALLPHQAGGLTDDATLSWWSGRVSRSRRFGWAEPH